MRRIRLVTTQRNPGHGQVHPPRRPPPRDPPPPQGASRLRAWGHRSNEVRDGVCVMSGAPRLRITHERSAITHCPEPDKRACRGTDGRRRRRHARRVRGAVHGEAPSPHRAGERGCEMECNAMQCNVTQRNVTQRNATHRNAPQRNATQFNATQRNATQRNAMQCNAMQHCIVT